MPSERLLALVTDPGSLRLWDTDLVSDDPLGFPGYRSRLAEAGERAGTTEAVVTGLARIGGRELAVVAGEFAFLAGTMGVASGERVVRAFDRAADAGLPVLGLPVSGGTRMQEGTAAFMWMATVAAAVQRFKDRGLPYVAYLRGPTTGGVLASWGALAHVTFAEPGALIGMTGPRIMEQLTGQPFPLEWQRAENLLAHGLVDAVVPAAELADAVARVLAVTSTPAAPWAEPGPPAEPLPEAEVDAWTAVQRTRRPDRPGLRQLLAASAEDVTVLRGDGAGGEDPGCVAALARVCGVPAVVIGHDRAPGGRGACIGAVGYRKARRAMALAAELALPIVTVVDTPGAEMSRAAEEGGLAAEIARCLATLTSVAVPTVSVLLGEGSGGGALALLPADRVIAAEHGWLAPISPEGASAILYRTTDRAPELAAAQATSSTALRRLGIVDTVVAEDGSRPLVDGVAAALAAALAAVTAQDPAARLTARRWRGVPLAAKASGAGEDVLGSQGQERTE